MERDPVVGRPEKDGCFWVGEFCRYGMTLSQAQVLAFEASCDRHAVRDALERGCDPDTAFLIFS